jgi:hypothetical protein
VPRCCVPFRQLGAVETLESNLANITLKKFDVECDMDPLFHKVTVPANVALVAIAFLRGPQHHGLCLYR